jgi:hypothetical protein
LSRFPCALKVSEGPNALFQGFGYAVLGQLLRQIGSQDYPQLRERFLNIIMSHSLYYVDLPGSPQLDRVLEAGALMEEFIKALGDLETQAALQRSPDQVEAWLLAEFNKPGSWVEAVSTTLFRSLALTASGKCGKNREFLLELNKYNTTPKEESVLILADYLQVKATLMTKEN